MNMSSKNLRREIPARAFINAQIIQQVRLKPDFIRAIQEILALPIYKNQGLSEYQYENPAHIVSLLYCLIVVPKELWAKPKENPIYKRIEEFCPLDLFQILISDKIDSNFSAYSLIHRLRNSISHANYSVDEKMTFIFWNGYSKTNEIVWKAKINSNNLMKFLSSVGILLANEGLRGE